MAYESPVTSHEPRFLDAAETLRRDQLAALQEAKLLDLLPYAYERSGLIRETWDAAGVHPREIRSLPDFQARAPFIDKNAIRSYRDRHGDPYGGLLCVSPEELTAVMSTSGTTGDPTLVPESWTARPYDRLLARELWEIGLRAGDHFSCMLFTFRGPFYASAHAIGAVPIFFDHHPAELERFCELSRRFRPTALYTLSGPLIAALAQSAQAAAIDMRDVLASYRGAVFAGEPLGVRARQLVREWGLQLFVQTGLGDVGAATECREHDGCHFWENQALVEHVDPDGTLPAADGERGELVATALDDRVAPLIRYRSDDLVRLTRAPCRCGRTHGRLWPLGRKGDEVRVQGRSIVPADIWPAIEAVEETCAGLFQVIRPQREVDRLRLRVGFAGDSAASDVARRVAAAVVDAVGIEAEIELVPNESMLRLGPPHKIPRTAAF
jgi:phenylacetate-CoA ligase